MSCCCCFYGQNGIKEPLIQEKHRGLIFFFFLIFYHYQLSISLANSLRSRTSSGADSESSSHIAFDVNFNFCVIFLFKFYLFFNNLCLGNIYTVENLPLNSKIDDFALYCFCIQRIKLILIIFMSFKSYLTEK